MNHTQLKKWLPAPGVVLLFFVFYVLFIAAHEAGHLLALRATGGDGSVMINLGSGSVTPTYAPFGTNSWQYGLFVIGGGFFGFVIIGVIYCIIKKCWGTRGDGSVWGYATEHIFVFYMMVLAGQGVLEFADWRWGVAVYKQSNLYLSLLMLAAALITVFLANKRFKELNAGCARGRPVRSFLVATALLGALVVALVGTCPATSWRPNQVASFSAQGLRIDLTAPSFYGVAGESPRFALPAADIPYRITTSDYSGSVGECRYFVRAGEQWLLQAAETGARVEPCQVLVAFYDSDGLLVYGNTFEYSSPLICAIFTPPILANNNYYVLTSVKSSAAGATVTVRSLTTINAC